jgi:hypothetical protein
MRLVPSSYRPSVVVRRKAARRGVLGTSSMWKGVAVFVFGANALRSAMGKRPERIDRIRLRQGERLTISTIKPMSRREQKRTGTTLAKLVAQAEADVRAAKRAS